MLTAKQYLDIETVLVATYVAEGMTQGDAQACAEADIWLHHGETMDSVSSRDPFAWVMALRSSTV